MMLDELVVIRRCRLVPEALVVRSILMGASIQAYVPDEHAFNMQPGLALVEGVRVMVRASDLERAAHYLSAEGDAQSIEDC